MQGRGVLECSTPFGINERFTQASDRAAGERLSAQRLSASTNDSRSSRTHISPRTTCAQRLSASTNDSHDTRRVEHRRVAVLNAFRHQRTIHVRWSEPPANARTSAQRLSASTNDSPAMHVARRPVLPVLNAFRHQRTIHLPMGSGPTAESEVLNAFRHQRTIHGAINSCSANGITCAQRLSASTNDSRLR